MRKVIITETETGEKPHITTGVEYTSPQFNARYEAYSVGPGKDEKGISTSVITKLIDNNTFETVQASYKLEEIKEDNI